MSDSKIKFGKETFVGKFAGVFLENYDVIKQLGKGGYGKVYEVKNKKTGDIRACKHLSKLNIKNLEKFEREIQILIKLDHPSIIKLYEVFESERSLYLVMEYCKGGEVFDRIIDHIQNKQMYSESDAAEMFIQVMSAIEYCHNHGICHRDLKPENLLYLNEGNELKNPIKVIDFGLSQLVDPSQKLTSKVGTAYYVAPEILQGNYTEKCDIWSMGVILYILLSGDPPFNGPSDNAIYAKIAKWKYSFPEKKWGNISDQAKDLIKHMLLPENERYNAKQVLAHPWVTQTQNNIHLTNLQFDPVFFKEYLSKSTFQKIVQLFIASRLNENEIRDLKKIFICFDRGNDGQISLQEFEQGLKQIKSNNLNENEINKLFESLDVDNNGSIDYTEFLAASMGEKIYLQQERLYEAFSVLDKDKSGAITKDELMSVLNIPNDEAGEVEKLMKSADKNGDGKIDYKEFLELMGYRQQEKMSIC